MNYTVTAADSIVSKTGSCRLTIMIIPFPGDWVILSITIGNDKSYNWYIDQSTSGNFASVNCGPASVTMAIKWADPAFTKTALDARMTYEVSGGWWFTNDIDAYLNDNNITMPLLADDQCRQTPAILKHQLESTDHHPLPGYESCTSRFRCIVPDG